MAEHINASFAGRHFRLDPMSIDWQFNSKVADLNTVGGKVIQVFGTKIGDLVVSGSFGKGGWEEQAAFLELMKAEGDRMVAATTVAGGTKVNPPHFRYPDKSWDFLVYLKEFSTPDGGRSVVLDNEIFAPKWTLTFHVVEDNSGLKTIAQDSYLSRIASGLGWKQTEFNGPIGVYMSEQEVEDYLAAQFGLGTTRQTQPVTGATLPAEPATASGKLPTTGIKKLAYDAVVQYWSKNAAAEWDALNKLVMSESSWNPTAQNPSSTAYGLFQFLDSTWAGVGGTKTSDPGLQITYGMRYIKNRYSDPIGAWAFHMAHGYY